MKREPLRFKLLSELLLSELLLSEHFECSIEISAGSG